MYRVQLTEDHLLLLSTDDRTIGFLDMSSENANTLVDMLNKYQAIVEAIKGSDLTVSRYIKIEQIIRGEGGA